ncbi:hypothetical protein [Burkholderia gladioli]|jgi:hypothetical protein|uniref:Uncharacterized protein n=1 Tax=Burkholderia gladioli TaxID=28095 RepID=A0AB38U247_BURGA|nr:hypothetical protein [Burkholderia gladioli]MBU9168812.1 hypothetical protein [Burkholderia gladioli]MBU9186760.1 hypothetical protein [Burkholderia gladioli]MBU9267524.1 hypothetical protein [Burkholderia gladioli]MBU9273792.1 hypothetical protein [Burkholderia gladioli]MBU9322626.1 hypothetical protein [Burkholderia gladioli]
MKNPASSSLLLGGFGTLWMTAWCLQEHGVDLPTLALILFAGGTIALWSRARDTDMHPGDSLQGHAARRRVFRRVNLAQWTAIVISNLALNASGHGAWFVAAVILIVGLHFLPLAHAFTSSRHMLTGLALIVVALAYPWLGRQQPGYPAGAFATGAILWASTLAGLLHRGASLGASTGSGAAR